MKRSVKEEKNAQGCLHCKPALRYLKQTKLTANSYKDLLLLRLTLLFTFDVCVLTDLCINSLSYLMSYRARSVFCFLLCKGLITYLRVVY